MSSISTTSDSSSIRRERWPADWDGTGLLERVRNGDPVFKFDIHALVHEIEDKLQSKVADIPLVTTGANCYVSTSMNRLDSV